MGCVVCSLGSRRLHPLFSHPLPQFPQPHHFCNSAQSIDFPVLLQGRLPLPHLLQIHTQILVTGAHQDNLTATRLIGHYPSPFSLRVLRQLHSPNIFPFNAIIRVLAEEGLFLLVFSFFRKLKHHSLSPNHLTFSFLLKSCFRSGHPFHVTQTHSHLIKSGLLLDPLISRSLLLVYSKGLRDLLSGRKVFDEMPNRSIPLCWSPLIDGCAKSGNPNEAMRLFHEMVAKERLRPEDETIISVLSACSTLNNSDIELWIKYLDLNVDSFVSDQLKVVLLYLNGRLGRVQECKNIFERISGRGKRSVLPWNTMMGVYVQNGCSMEALCLFRTMIKSTDCPPNHVTMVNALSACAHVGDINLGSWIHEYMETKGSKGVVRKNIFLATALIDMYSKCGSLSQAKGVFYRMEIKDIVAFNTMIMGMAVNGDGREVFTLFCEMHKSGLRPNSGTFLAILCACAHSGLFIEGRRIFLDMKKHHLIPLEMEHYTAYIDLLSRNGFVEEAFGIAASLPFEANRIVWGALLSGCLLHSRVGLAQHVFRRLVEVGPDASLGYVMMSNVFAVGGHWCSISGLRSSMKERGVRKQYGHSLISIEGVLYEFVVGTPSHPEIKGTCHTLNISMKESIMPIQSCI